MIRSTLLQAVLLAVAAVTVSPAAPPPSGSGGKVRLALNLVAGKTWDARLTWVQRLALGEGAGRPESEQSWTLGYRFRVTEAAPSGAADVRVTFRSLSFRGAESGAVTVWDSSMPPASAPPAVLGLTPLLGLDFVMRIGPGGRLVSIQGLDREMVDALAGVFPDHPVGVGDSWRRTVSLTRGFPLTLESVWKLSQRGGGKAVLDVSSAVKPRSGGTPLTIGPFTVAGELTGTQTGTVWLTEATGWPERVVSRQSFTGRIIVGGGGPPAVLSGEGTLTLE
jgi:hypothetical protein